jgi:hypothetical protein
MLSMTPNAYKGMISRTQLSVGQNSFPIQIVFGPSHSTKRKVYIEHRHSEKPPHRRPRQTPKTPTEPLKTLPYEFIHTSLAQLNRAIDKARRILPGFTDNYGFGITGNASLSQPTTLACKPRSPKFKRVVLCSFKDVQQNGLMVPVLRYAPRKKLVEKNTDTGAKNSFSVIQKPTVGAVGNNAIVPQDVLLSYINKGLAPFLRAQYSK